jgi:D-alanine-D-alanine ligase
MTKQTNSIKVAVLMGGIGSERQVSLQSGACVVEALTQAGIETVAWDVSPEALEILDDPSVDVFFLALHGEFGEDGQLQQILAKKGLAYTGSGPEACQLTFDKLASKVQFKRLGLTTPASVVFSKQWSASELGAALDEFGTTVVVKPPKQGSSVGVHIVPRDAELWSVCRQVADEYGACMIEEYIPGKELTVGILQDRALPVIEVRAQNQFYDYQAKYDTDDTLYLFDTLTGAEAESLQAQALACFQGLGLRHYARIDYIVSEEGTPYVLEVNTIPGLTSHSLLPKAAKQAGISMGQLCRSVVQATCSE